MGPNELGYVAILISIAGMIFLVLKSRKVLPIKEYKDNEDKKKQRFFDIWSAIAMFIAGVLLVVGVGPAENVAFVSLFVITGFLFLIYKGNKVFGITKIKVDGTKAKA